MQPHCEESQEWWKRKVPRKNVIKVEPFHEEKAESRNVEDGKCPEKIFKNWSFHEVKLTYTHTYN